MTVRISRDLQRAVMPDHETVDSDINTRVSTMGAWRDAVALRYPGARILYFHDAAAREQVYLVGYVDEGTGENHA